jgi:subfamily B ATP-binding cassette protein MsbA
MKDSLTLIVLVGLMFYQNWKLAFFALLMMPLAAFVAKTLGKRIGKVTKQSIVLNASLVTYLSEMLKGTRMIKIFQQEKFETDRSSKILTENKDIRNKIAMIMIRATPIMEVLTGFMIAGFIYYSGFMISSGEMGINNFFSFFKWHEGVAFFSYKPSITVGYYYNFAIFRSIFKHSKVADMNWVKTTTYCYDI